MAFIEPLKLEYVLQYFKVETLWATY